MRYQARYQVKFNSKVRCYQEAHFARTHKICNQVTSQNFKTLSSLHTFMLFILIKDKEMKYKGKKDLKILLLRNQYRIKPVFEADICVANASVQLKSITTFQFFAKYYKEVLLGSTFYIHYLIVNTFSLNKRELTRTFFVLITSKQIRTLGVTTTVVLNRGTEVTLGNLKSSRCAVNILTLHLITVLQPPNCSINRQGRVGFRELKKLRNTVLERQAMFK